VSKTNRINSLVGLKVLALACIYCLHSGIWPRFGSSWEFGWGVDVFFLASGFLIARNHYADPNWGGWSVGLKYVYGKLLTIWPLHFVAFCIALPASLFGSRVVLDWSYVWKACYNLLLLQAWSSPSRELAYSFNGPSWFLSALLFCYLLAPALLAGMRCVRRPVALLVAVCLVRAFIWQGQLKYNLFAMDVYTSPILRLCDFACAMSAYPVWIACKRTLGRMSVKFVWVVGFALELMAIITLVCFAYGSIHIRATHWVVFIDLLCILILALEIGPFSRVLGAVPFRLIGAVELEIYILHGAVMKGAWNHLHFIKDSFLVFETLNLFLIVACACVWNLYLRIPVARVCDRMVRRFYSAIKSEYARFRNYEQS